MRLERSWVNSPDSTNCVNINSAGPRNSHRSRLHFPAGRVHFSAFSAERGALLSVRLRSSVNCRHFRFLRRDLLNVAPSIHLKNQEFPHDQEPPA